jgi:hypothetical protein
MSNYLVNWVLPDAYIGARVKYMEPDYMENLARAYHARLNTSRSAEDPLLDEARDLVERQLIAIDQMLAGLRQPNRALSYLKSLKQFSERKLTALGAGGKVPTYSHAAAERPAAAYTNLLEMQIELFITLDHLKENGIEVGEIIDNETRALGFMNFLR